MRKCAAGCGGARHPGRAYCRPCENAQERERNRRNPLRHRRHHLKHRYGITPEQYDQMAETQGGVCALCHGALKDRKKLLSVDHDHTTGAVRGLLCTRCNAAIGVIDDVPGWLERAAAYLERRDAIVHETDDLG